MNPGTPARALAVAGAATLALSLFLPEEAGWNGPLAAGLVFLLLPFAVLVVLLCWMAGAAVPLTLLAWLALPRRWLRGVPASAVFCAAMLAAPVLLLSGVAVSTLASKDVVWEEFAWTPTERPPPSPTMRHLFPTRSSIGAD